MYVTHDCKYIHSTKRHNTTKQPQERLDCIVLLCDEDLKNIVAHLGTTRLETRKGLRQEHDESGMDSGQARPILFFGCLFIFSKENWTEKDI